MNAKKFVVRVFNSVAAAELEVTSLRAYRFTVNEVIHATQKVLWDNRVANPTSEDEITTESWVVTAYKA